MGEGVGGGDSESEPGSMALSQGINVKGNNLSANSQIGAPSC